MSNFEIVKRPSGQPAPTDRVLQFAEAAKAGIEPLSSFTGEERQPGPVLATVTAHAATVWTVVDDSIAVPMVRVYCTDPDSPHAQAARETRIRHTGQQLTVTVPALTAPPRTVRPSGRTTYVSGSGSSYSFSAVGDMHINSGGVTVVNGYRGIEIELLLPPGSGLKSDTTSCSVHTFGHLAAAKIDVSSGSVYLESAGRAEIEASSGSVRIGTVTEWVGIDASSGSVTVTRHAGHTARVRASSGSVTFTIAPQATGTVDVRSSSGSVALYGSHRPDMTITAKTSSGTVRRP